ncbi:MAG TPA: acid phosphatase, partial [Rhodanobacter sp.]|nr:acid phosphatase [Rhodanobacter sp.]
LTDPARRRLLGGLAAAGATLAVGAARAQPPAPAAAKPLAGAAFDAALRERIRHIVVIYAENRSFNNLFAEFPGLAEPLSAVPPERYRQRDRDGSVLATLPPIWRGLVPRQQVVNHRSFEIGENAIANLPNAPFALATPDGRPLPHGVVTRDLIHAFYANQLQINGGKNDGFVAWGDSGALVMGHYADSATNLRLWNLAREYTLCDRFFMGAFGGSFLNHQYLVAAQPPYYPHADASPAKLRIAQVLGNDPAGIQRRLSPTSPASAMQGRPEFAGASSLTPDFWAVNTMGPPYAPAFTTDPANPAYAKKDDYGTLPPQVHATIGDRLSAKGIGWAWYAGAWQLALDGRGDDGLSKEFPPSPNFQVHHQPFNYYRAFAPGTPARAAHLRDGGYGETARTNRLLADIAAGTLPAVTFYKPQGDLNMHAGYSDVDAGDRHVTQVVDAIQASALWPHTLIVITVDENGGWWDHIAPPKGDRWGPGTRIPALVVSPYAKRSHVEHTTYDTGSIQRLINRRFGLAPLPGIVLRDQAMRAATGYAPGDLTETLQFDA